MPSLPSFLPSDYVDQKQQDIAGDTLQSVQSKLSTLDLMSSLGSKLVQPTQDGAGLQPTQPAPDTQPAPVAAAPPAGGPAPALPFDGTYYQDPNFEDNLQRYGSVISSSLGPEAGRLAQAQARLETGNGQHLSTPYNYGNLNNTDSDPNGGDSFSSPEEAAQGWLKFVDNGSPTNTYAPFLDSARSGAPAPALAADLANGGWAKDPAYATKLTNLLAQPSQQSTTVLKPSESALRGSTGLSSVMPQNVTNAGKYLGSTDWQDDAGHSLCEQFVENMEGTTGRYPSAIAAWQDQAPTDPTKLRQQQDIFLAPVGSNVYFDDPNQPNGHTGIYMGKGEFISRDDKGVEQWNIKNWTQATGQQFLGWTPSMNQGDHVEPVQPAPSQHAPTAQLPDLDALAQQGQAEAQSSTPEVTQAPEPSTPEVTQSPLQGLAQGVGNVLQGEKQFTQPLVDTLQKTGALDLPVIGGIVRGLVEDPLGNAARVGADAAGGALAATGIGAPAGIGLAAGINAGISGLEGAGEAAGGSNADIAKSAGLNAALGGVASAAGGVLGTLVRKVPVAEVVKDAGSADPAALVGTLASKLANNELPLMAGGAPGATPMANKLLTSMQAVGQAIPEGTAPEEAVRVLTSNQDANTILARGLGDEFQKALAQAGVQTTEQQAPIIQAIETGTTDQLPENLRALADQTSESLRTAWQAGNRAGLGSDMLDNYFSHIVRPLPEAEQLRQLTLGGRSINSFSNFMQGRARDEAGNVKLPTLDDVQAYLDEVHPGSQVVRDIPTVIEAHTKSLADAADKAQYISFLKTAKASDGIQPALSVNKAPGYVRMDNPGLAQWVYRGTTPEEGPVIINRQGVQGGAHPSAPDTVQAPGEYSDMGGQPVMENMQAFYVHPEFAGSVKAYLSQAIGRDIDNPFVRGYHNLNSLVVGLKLFNIAVHGMNMTTELLKQHSLGAAAGAAAGFSADSFAHPDATPGERIGATLGGAALGAGALTARSLLRANDLMSDPAALQQLVRDSGLRLSVSKSYAQALHEATGTIGETKRSIPIVGGILDWNHKTLFETLGQRMQIASYLDATDRGAAPDVAAAYANNKFGQLRTEELGQVSRWIQQNGLFAGQWTLSRARQWAAVAGAPGLGGSTSSVRQFGLSDAENGQLANMLRRDVMGGTGLLLGTTAMLNHGISGKWPWENDPGRYLDINTGQKDKNGNTVYVTNPMFRGEQDLIHLLSSPVTKVEQLAGVPDKYQAEYGMGTNTLQTVANKLPPVVSAARNVATNEQFLGGPPIEQQGDNPQDGFLKAFSFAANQVSPAGVTAQNQRVAADGKKLTTPGPLQVQAPFGPAYVEGQGLQDTAAVREQPSSGAVATILGARASDGPKFTGDDQEKKAQQKELLGETLPAKYYGVQPGSDRQKQIDQAVTAYEAWRRDPKGIEKPTPDVMKLAFRYAGNTTYKYQKAVKAQRTAQDQAGTFVLPSSSG